MSIEELNKYTANKISEVQLNADELLPRYTIVFDREASSTPFFDSLWKKYRVAILTYKKNVKDKWNEQDFSPYKIDTDVKTNILLYAYPLHYPR